MSETGKEVLDAIMQAIEIEKETFDLYTRAEQKTFNPAGKRIFRWLARTEEEHYLKLAELYKSYSDGERWVFYGGSTIALDPEEGEPGGFDTGDLEALEIAMAIERKGIAHFDQLAQKAADPDGRQMFKTLADEEREHLKLISDRYDALKGAK
ncbi:MAG: ferritin family protein [Geobacteraceae bacterium]|nr:ferritin family protein [Geobacteraceae bacterium]